jgi:hypothetical protein
LAAQEKDSYALAAERQTNQLSSPAIGFFNGCKTEAGGCVHEALTTQILVLHTLPGHMRTLPVLACIRKRWIAGFKLGDPVWGGTLPTCPIV